MSLRRRVLLGLVAVSVVLGVAGVVIAGTMRSYLWNQVDRQLGSVSALRGFRRPGGPAGTANDPGTVLSDLAFVLTDANGKVVLSAAPSLQASAAPLPNVDKLVPFPAGGSDLRYGTVGSVTDDGTQYRVKVERLAPGRLATTTGEDIGYAIVAVPLHDTVRTFHHIVFIELMASLAALGALGLSGWWLLRHGVRPLDRIAAAADQIAAGDLTHRVPVDDTRTEAGRLGAALNRMLDEIEGAFRRKQASEDQLKRFVADASHELRTPLTSIRGYADLWRHGALDGPDQLNDAMRRVEAEAARMGRLVEDLLLLARLDEGRPLERQPVDVAAVVRDAVADAQAAEPARPVTVQTPDRAVVVGDPDRLHQVVANLLANTRVHTPPGTPVEVTVTAATDQVSVAVRDHGPGLSTETVDHLFERFSRADPARGPEHLTDQ